MTTSMNTTGAHRGYLKKYGRSQFYYFGFVQFCLLLWLVVCFMFALIVHQMLRSYLYIYIYTHIYLEQDLELCCTKWYCTTYHLVHLTSRNWIPAVCSLFSHCVFRYPHVFWGWVIDSICDWWQFLPGLCANYTCRVVLKWGHILFIVEIIAIELKVIKPNHVVLHTILITLLVQINLTSNIFASLHLPLTACGKKMPFTWPEAFFCLFWKTLGKIVIFRSFLNLAARWNHLLFIHPRATNQEAVDLTHKWRGMLWR